MNFVGKFLSAYFLALSLLLWSSGALKADGVSGDQKANGDISPKDKINFDRDSSGRSVITCKDGSAVTQDMIRQWVSADKAKRSGNHWKYVYIPPDLLANEVDANLARIGLFKALNHTAVAADDIYTGEDVSEGHCAVYALDVTKYWGSEGERKWNVIVDLEERKPFSPAPRLEAKAIKSDPVPADQLAYNAVYGNVYNELIDTPGKEGQLRRSLNIGNDVKAVMAIKNAIVYGPRIVYMRELADGRKYWISVDEFANKEGSDLPTDAKQAPDFTNTHRYRGFQAQAHEAWAEMKNGFMTYYIWGNAAQERSKAEKIFVKDCNNGRGQDLITGRSCITCHMVGVQAAPSDYDGGGGWSTNQELAQYYDESRARFQEAMRKIVNNVSSGDRQFNDDIVLSGGFEKREPVNFLLERVEGTGAGEIDMHCTGGGNNRSNGGSGRGGDFGGGGGW